MNRKITQALLGAMTLVSFCKISAQNFQTLSVSSGYNADLIANGSGTAASSTTASVDDPTNGFVFMSADFVNGAGASPTNALPANGMISSWTTVGLPFQLAPYSSNNALRLINSNDSGTLSFSTAPKASKIYMLATSGSGSSTTDVVVNFSDGTSQSASGLTVNDWYGGASFAIKGIGRVSRVSDNIENNVGDPRLYEIPITITSANQFKNISGVTVKKVAGSGITCVFGISYIAAGSCVTPDNLTAANIAASSATISWAPVQGTSTYEIYRDTDNMNVPTSSTTPTMSGISGTSANMTGLTTDTAYYVWVRSNCGGGNVSEWSPVYVAFTTPCTAVNTPYMEDFNATTGMNIPACTSKQILNSNTDWYVMDFTGVVATIASRAVMSLQNSAGNTNNWFYTRGINLQAGSTYTLSFKYANYGYPESFKVAYGTSPVNTSMNVLLAYPNVTGMSAVTATLTVNPTVSGVYYFGFNHDTVAPGQGAIIFDNISVTKDVLSTSESNLADNNISVYPNPASDYLFVKSKKKVAGLKILDASGKMVSAINKAENKVEISQLVKGNYLLTVENADGTSSTHKFIKK